MSSLLRNIDIQRFIFRKLHVYLPPPSTKNNNLQTSIDRMPLTQTIECYVLVYDNVLYAWYIPGDTCT